MTHRHVMVRVLRASVRVICTDVLQCSPRKVLEMYSDTWLPERLISDRWLSSRFSILLNCERKQRNTFSLEP